MREQMQSVLAEKFDTHPDVIAFHEGLAYVDERRLAQMHGAELPVENANGSNGSSGRILPGSTRSISFADAVNALLAENRLPKIRYEYWAPQTQPLGTGGDMHFAFSYAVHASLVSVDTETGEVAVERVISAHDVGRAINPLSLLGQIEGGIVMGIGNALTENYIVEDGIPWTERLGQYKMPSIKMTPRMDSHIVEHPTADGPYGAKGVGEISSIPISPAITNAIYKRCGCSMPGPCRSIRTHCCWRCETERKRSTVTGARQGSGKRFVFRDGISTRSPRISMQLHQALRLPPKELSVVTLVGAGGKTSTLFRLADEAVAGGRRVVTTTTTHIFAAQAEQAPARLEVRPHETDIVDWAALEVELARHGHCLIWSRPGVQTPNAAGKPTAFSQKKSKRQGLPPQVVDALAARAGDLGISLIAIEGDGSRRRPVKAPASHEPVIPACTTHLVPIAGLDGLGLPLDEP